MANLPEKNITTVDKITSIPGNTNLYINANGEFRQASIDDVLKASPVIADSIANQYKNASGSPILLTDSAEGVAIEFNAKGRSTQDGEPNPDYPQAIKSVGDMGWFDGELLQGAYSGSSGAWGSTSTYVCNKNIIPCKANDKIKLEYEETTSQLMILFYDSNKNFISFVQTQSSNVLETTVIADTCYFNFNIANPNGITPTTAKPITVTINDKYALIVDSVGKNKVDITTVKGMGRISATTDGNTIVVGAYPEVYGVYFDNSDVGLRVGETYTFSVENVDNYNASGGHGFRVGYADGTFVSMNGLEMTATIEKEVSTINFYLGTPYTGNLESRIEGLMIRPQGTDDTYEPYIHSRKYIPISAPLRSSLDESVKDEVSLSENKVTRRIARKRIVTVSKNNGTDVNNYCYYCTLGNVGRSNSGMSNNLPNLLLYEVTINGTENIGQYVSVEYGVVYINVGKHLTENTVEGMTAWLAENPTYIQYELAEPTTESIEPVEVDTFEGVTQISVSDNADMEVEYPTSKVAGIASIGWSKGRRAEYDLEQLKAQMLALQTTIVSTV